LLSFGDRIVVMQPEELRVLLCDAASATATHHKSQGPIERTGK